MAKKLLYTLYIIGACGGTLAAGPVEPVARTTILAAQPAGVGAGVAVDSATLTRSGDYIDVGLRLAFDSLRVRSNQALLLRPLLVNGGDSAALPAVAIYGRSRYYHYLRANGPAMLSGAGETTLRSNALPAGGVSYRQTLGYQPWMDGATLLLERSDYGCCSEARGPVVALAAYAEPREWFPTLVYVQPPGQAEKRRELRREAYVDFPVDRTEIHPDYRNNPEELAKIVASIDTVRDDPDATITAVWLKGYASPESPYAHNADLARGRTAAIKEYIMQLYHFADTLIATDYEPENWAGLRRAVAGSNLDHRAELLALIDSDMADLDAKERRIKGAYPKEYRFMLQNFYPALRRTEYRVEYVVRTFSDVGEIRRLMRSAPQKLSLNELYLAAEGLEPGSEEFTEVFETAVRMFPDDPAANLNAANAALRRDDLGAAERYLARAGTSAEAVYARAALALRSGDLAAARPLLRQAADMGLEQAAATLMQLPEE